MNRISGDGLNAAVLDTAKRMEINGLMEFHAALMVDHGVDSPKAQEIALLIAERLRKGGQGSYALWWA